MSIYIPDDIAVLNATEIMDEIDRLTFKKEAGDLTSRDIYRLRSLQEAQALIAKTETDWPVVPTDLMDTPF